MDSIDFTNLMKLFWRNFKQLAFLQVGDIEPQKQCFVAGSDIIRMSGPRKKIHRAFGKSLQRKIYFVYVLSYFLMKEHP